MVIGKARFLGRKLSHVGTGKDKGKHMDMRL
jgi:hypothetical protein